MGKPTKKSKETEERQDHVPAETPTEGMETLRQELDQLRQEMENARKEKDEVSDRLQRVYADYANFQKRVPKNIADTVTYEKEKFIRSFLPILDNLERTLREAPATQNVDTVVQGVEIIRDQMLATLKSHGVEPIVSLHEKFDPQRHEAMLRRSEPDRENDIVLEEFQRGYLLNDRVLRPSRVAINKIQAPAGGRPPAPVAPAEKEASQPGTEAPKAAAESDSNTE
ncbi:MAG: nucleotide exchange factor GrpE [Planctomycetes bacterium]|nr:nucleotide exchange factor GrpE [Planctomycetota bacterium]